MSERTDDYDFTLPDELIADRPLEQRMNSRMMVIHRDTGEIEHKNFSDITDYIGTEDRLVLNDTKVIPARVFSNDGTIELVVVEQLSATKWVSMVRPGKKMKVGREVHVGEALGRVLEILEDGNRVIEWDQAIDLDEHGKLALPHYMGRDSDVEDRERYQTVYAKNKGAIAAPTAGLHFTPEILDDIPHTFLTLHVGIGTFRPVKAELIKDHEMHSEKYVISENTADEINQAERVIAVGTTCTRVLESVVGEDKKIEACSGATDIFLHPPYRFKRVDALLTNFHLPKSTLIMLVSAFGGKDLILKAYEEAVREKYRFFSYGDCMLIL